jgi:hypothetical protein
MGLVQIGGVLSAGVLSLIVTPVLAQGMLQRDAERAATRGKSGDSKALLAQDGLPGAGPH